MELAAGENGKTKEEISGCGERGYAVCVPEEDVEERVGWKRVTHCNDTNGEKLKIEEFIKTKSENNHNK